MLALAAYGGQCSRQQNGEQDERQQLHVGGGGHQVGGDHGEQNVADAGIGLGLYLFREDTVVQRQADARLNDIDHHQADNDRDARGHDKIQHGDAAQASQLADIAQGGHTADHRRDDQRQDQHFQCVEE